jgi:DDE family transposase
MPPYPESIQQWAALVHEHFPCLSRPQAFVLALWSYAAQALHCCGQSQVAFFLARLLAQPEPRLRQRLREWTWEGAAKSGQHRQAVTVAPCFGYLLSWVVSAWAPGEQRLALALDATSLGQRFVVLAVSVLYRGCAIPIAWQVLPASTAGAWRPYWLSLLSEVRGLVPADWLVLVLADRGLFAAWLFTAIQQQGWHPFLRINADGKCRPEGASEFRPLASLLRPPGQVWRGRVLCFKGAQLPASLLVYADAHYADPWLILTDLAPEAAEVSWYGLRAWIEASFKDTKRGGWQWQRTRMTDPERASRLWLVLALALLYTINVGGQTESPQPASMLAELPHQSPPPSTPHRRPQPRRLSLVTQGHLTFLADLIRHRHLPTLAAYAPNPWPTFKKTYP